MTSHLLPVFARIDLAFERGEGCWLVATSGERYLDFGTGIAVNSLVSGGCIISGAHVQRSLLFSNVRVNSFCHVEDSVVLPNVNIGRNCRIRRAVIDKGCRIPEGSVIGEDEAHDASRFHRTEGGVTLITADMLGQTAHEDE